MADPYEPMPVLAGYGAEVTINANFEEIQTAFRSVVNRLDSASNQMSVDLDMDGYEILNCPTIESPDMIMNTYTVSEMNSTHLAADNAYEIIFQSDGSPQVPYYSDGTEWKPVGGGGTGDLTFGGGTIVNATDGTGVTLLSSIAGPDPTSVQVVNGMLELNGPGSSVSLEEDKVTVQGLEITNESVNFGFQIPLFPEVPVSWLGSLPASAFPNGVIIIPDETGGRTLATSDGTNWRRVSDGAIAS